MIEAECFFQNNFMNLFLPTFQYILSSKTISFQLEWIWSWWHFFFWFFDTKSNNKQSFRSYSLQFEMKWIFISLSVLYHYFDWEKKIPYKIPLMYRVLKKGTISIVNDYWLLMGVNLVPVKRIPDFALVAAG